MNGPESSAWVPDLSGRRHIHVIAVGGAAMSAIAVILHRMGHAVSGSDESSGPVLEDLRAQGIDVHVGHDSHHVAHAELVTHSAAIQRGNVELDAAIEAGLPIATRGDMMEAIATSKRTVAISGTAGKTTTSAMAAYVFDHAGLDPSFIVGGNVRQLGGGVAWRPGPWFVAEADESDASFLRFRAEAVIVNNVEEDHLDYWGDMASLEAGFECFVSQASGPKVLGLDDAGSRRLSQRVASANGVVTFGVAADARYRIVGWAPKGLGSSFRVECDGEPMLECVLTLPGMHNARNATAVIALTHLLGIDPQKVVESLSRFSGVGRRFEHRGAARGVTFVDDYAHLPSKVAAAVTGAKAGPWRRIVAVFQPHRYTRTQAQAGQFGSSFAGADVVVVTDVYAAGQAPIPGVSGRLVADAVAVVQPGARVIYVESRAELRRELEAELRAGDLCLTMNAGDLTTLPTDMLASPWAALPGPAKGRQP